ncbi:hypothetical protein DPMN_092829 [Dreissena polymorpha]|uniref:Uncharacterized protein n=1 Tax=Dreissena polymorpha TaxID=45954 RepID=A0A9D4L285_DREPO|nr:hypothetical protein DPMN_092829 [Dreissena polymorpha]
MSLKQLTLKLHATMSLVLGILRPEPVVFAQANRLIKDDTFRFYGIFVERETLLSENPV